MSYIIYLEDEKIRIIDINSVEARKIMLDCLIGQAPKEEEKWEEEIVKPKKVKKIKSLKYILGKGIEPVSCPICNRVTKFPVDIAIEEGLRPTEILLGCGCAESYKLEIVKEK